jgi:hypothetical protein
MNGNRALPAKTGADTRRLVRRRFAQRGVAALEAVLVLPLMVFIVIGGVEMYLYTRVAAILDRVAFTLANSISIQQDPLVDDTNCTTPGHICTYGTLMPQLMQPLDYANKGAVILSLYATDAPSNGNPPTLWRAIASPNRGWTKTYQGASAPTPTSRITNANLPTTLISHNTQTADTLIVVEVFYEYKPFAMTGSFFKLLFNTHQYSHAIIRPRYIDLCTLNPPGGSACGT